MATATMINKKTYVSATFLDEERKNIEVLLDMPHTETKTLTPHVIEADPKSAEYKALLKLVSEDQLHEETWEAKRAESEAFLATARQVIASEFDEAKDAVDIDALLTKTKIYPTIVDTLFTNMENEDHLFALKLALFEVQDIRESTDTAAKTALRKSKNKIDVLKHAFDIVGVRRTVHDSESIVTNEYADEQLQTLDATPQKSGTAGAGVDLDAGAMKEIEKTIPKTDTLNDFLATEKKNKTKAKK